VRLWPCCADLMTTVWLCRASITKLGNMARSAAFPLARAAFCVLLVAGVAAQVRLLGSCTS
jgi:hypothetical protein